MSTYSFSMPNRFDEYDDDPLQPDEQAAIGRNVDYQFRAPADASHAIACDKIDISAQKGRFLDMITGNEIIDAYDFNTLYTFNHRDNHFYKISVERLQIELVL